MAARDGTNQGGGALTVPAGCSRGHVQEARFHTLRTLLLVPHVLLQAFSVVDVPARNDTQVTFQRVQAVWMGVGVWGGGGKWTPPTPL
jgi:hypothetical protein